jgi:hypothetical protein
LLPVPEVLYDFLTLIACAVDGRLEVAIDSWTRMKIVKESTSLGNLEASNVP